MAGRVLIVDDEPYILRILAYKLRREGYVAYEAASAAEAREILATREVDLILLDIALERPDSGFELAEELRADPRHRELPIVMLTARSLADDIRRGRDLGAMGYVTKPFSTQELLETVRSILPPSSGPTRQP